MTSTTIQGLELRVWGDIKSLHERAKKVVSVGAGQRGRLQARHLHRQHRDEAEQVRDLRKGIWAFL